MMKRAGKVGDMAAIERKLEERYDKEQSEGLHQGIFDWINAVLQGEKGFQPCDSTEWKDIAKYLSDGSVLCKFINKLREADGQKKVSFNDKPKQSFACMSNIETFNTAAREYGLKSDATFQTTDLVDGRKGPLCMVFNCLNQLGFAANSKGFKPAYTPPAKAE